MSKMTKSEAGKLGFLASQEQQLKRHEEFVASYMMSPKTCSQCNEVINFEKRRNNFCSHTCAARHTNVVRGRKLRETKPHDCPICNKEIPYEFKCCSYACSKERMYREFVELWLIGKESGIVCEGMSVSTHIRRWIKEKRGNKCEICGWCEKHPITGRVPLQLDHINGNPLDNKSDNLRLLCPNCHSLTPTFGVLNKGKGRKVRYAQK